MQNFEASFSGILRGGGGRNWSTLIGIRMGWSNPFHSPRRVERKNLGFLMVEVVQKKFFSKNFFFVFSTFWAIWDIFHFFEKNFLKNFFGPKGGPFENFFFQKIFSKNFKVVPNGLKRRKNVKKKKIWKNFFPPPSADSCGRFSILHHRLLHSSSARRIL